MKEVNARRLLHLLWLPLLLSLLLATPGCKDEKANAVVVTKGPSDHFAIRLGAKTVSLQFAVHPAEQQQGLMHRRDLGADEGMIFVYRKPQSLSYWMRNTPTPLDIGYFDQNGVLLEVYPLLPYDEKPVKSRSDRIQFAVEMRQGWYGENRVRPGDKLGLEQVAEALRQRGFTPAEFGLN